VKQIELTQSKVALVDDCDYDYLSRWRWYVLLSGGIHYAARTALVAEGHPVTRRMHREILGFHGSIPPLDHIDGDGLNNRRANLRVCTIQQNSFNRRQYLKTRSGYKGVYWNNLIRKWVAGITHNGKQLYLGSYGDKHTAALAYNYEAAKRFGEFAKLNIIKEGVE